MKIISNKKRNIPLIVIVAGINILEKWVKNNFSDNIIFATSLIYYLNNNIALA